MEVRLSEWMCRYKDRYGTFLVTLNQLLSFVKSHDMSLTDVESTEDKFFDDKLCLLLRDWRFRTGTDDRDELIQMLIDKIGRLVSEGIRQQESHSDLVYESEQCQRHIGLLKEEIAKLQQEQDHADVSDLVQKLAKLKEEIAKLQQEQDHADVSDLVQEIAILKKGKDQSDWALHEANELIAGLALERDERQRQLSDMDKLAQALPPAVRQAAAWIRDELPLLLERQELLEPALASIPILALRQTHKFMNASLAFGDNHDNSQESIFKLFDNLFRGRVEPGDMEPLEVKLPQHAQEERGIRSRNNRRLLALRAFQSTQLDECIMVPCRVHSHQEYMANHKFRDWFDKGDDGGSGWSILNREGRSKHRGVPIFNNAAAAQRGLHNLYERLHHREASDSERVRSLGSLSQGLRRRPVSQGDSDEETLTLDHGGTQAPFEPFRRQSSDRGRTPGVGRTPRAPRRRLSEPPSETRPRSRVEQSERNSASVSAHHDAQTGGAERRSEWQHAWNDSRASNDGYEARAGDFRTSWEHAWTWVSSSAWSTWAGQQAAQASRHVWDRPSPPDPSDAWTWRGGVWEHPGPRDPWSRDVWDRPGPPSDPWCNLDS
ncbi:unnamed protein product [Symbiodinium sp. CCMP2592]|nr:unnamed protein product [Symbiodinium sp. CCMP2592]